MDTQIEMEHVPHRPFAFSSKTVRHAFLWKVYGILAVQLAMTACTIALFFTIPGIRIFMIGYGGWFVSCVSFLGALVFLITLQSSDDLRRRWPDNFFCLFGFTAFESILLATLTCQYDTGLVLIAAGITAVTTIGLTLFAFQTKIDFTKLNGILFSCLMNFIGFSLLMLFFPNKTLLFVLSAIGATIFSVYLVHDTSMMIGGTHEHSISPEEYIFASILLYLDIVNIFIEILRMLNSDNRRRD